jgi:rSAM/selenodomain-associated transferase 2
MSDPFLKVEENSLISVIIPTLNEENHINACLQAARQSYAADAVEIIVVDGGSTDATLDNITPDCTLLQTQPGRGSQMNTGARHSNGKVLVFCHGDTRLPDGWRRAVIEALNRPGVSGGTFQTRMEPARGILKWRNSWRMPADWRFMYGDQCQFMRRTTFEAIGGFPEIPLMEDVEMSRALNRTGRVVRINLRAVTSSRRLLEKGILRQTLGNFWRMVRYLYLKTTPEALATTYRSSREEAE